MNVWITKHALTNGIKEIEAECYLTEDSIRDTAVGVGAFAVYYIGEGKEWHRTLEGAQARAENMRLAKITSLERQLSKLRNLKFQ